MESGCPELTKALCKARLEIGKIKKAQNAKIETKGGSSFSYAYADLADVLDAITKPLADNGLAIIQTTRTDPAFQLVTTLAHTSGESITGYMPLPEADGDARSLGSWLTYLRRYSACAIVGVAPEEDDDAAKAQPRKTEPVADKTLAARVQKLAEEAGGWTGEPASEVLIRLSSFVGKDGKKQSFSDPYKVRSEKWLASVESKLRDELVKTAGEQAMKENGDELPF